MMIRPRPPWQAESERPMSDQQPADFRAVLPESRYPALLVVSLRELEASAQRLLDAIRKRRERR